MQAAIRMSLRSIATALSFAVLLHQFAHAATPSPRLTGALLRHAAHAKQAQIPAPIQQTGSQSSPEALARNRVLAAHSVFLAKSTQDANFPASPDDAYDLVLRDLRTWGRFQIATDVTHADLVLQLRDAVHVSVVDNVNDPGSTVYYNPSFQLTLADPSTLSPLWTVSSAIPRQ